MSKVILKIVVGGCTLTVFRALVGCYCEEQQ